MSEKRYPWEQAYAVAATIAQALRPVCARAVIAGSLRRHKPAVGDVEILYVPIMQEEPDPSNMFATRLVSLADGCIEGLERSSVLKRRLNSLGHETFGPKNKLMQHVGTGIPVDLFAATEENWFNYLVCRTGPAELNARIATLAQGKGWKWNPYGPGFSCLNSKLHLVRTEQDVFDFVGLPYREPARRT